MDSVWRKRLKIHFIVAGAVLILSGGARGQAQIVVTEPDLFTDSPDVDVTYIERTPRYPAYTLSYDAPGKSGLAVPTGPKTGKVMSAAENAAMQRWPKAGEVVTYTAHFINKGKGDYPAFPFKWLFDGKVVNVGSHKENLAPGTEATETLRLKWQNGPHTLEFQADPLTTLPDRFPANNRLTITTDAMTFIWAVDRVTYDGFNKVRNFTGSYSFEDWCNWHVQRMNELIRISPSAIQPNGGGHTRVRADRIVVLENLEKEWEPLGGPFGKLAAGFDGSWPFGRNPDVRMWAARPDWGLIHEWAHQLGLTDEYALDRAASTNLVPDANGNPLLMGRMSNLTGYMMHGHGPVMFSPECSAALEIQYRNGVRRRGYYGDYYYDTPKQTTIKVLDNAGKPVPDAALTFYQASDETGGVFRKPEFSVKTGRAGEAVLPNKPAPQHHTHQGFTLHPNPFGKINVVGGNAVMFIKVEARGQTDYTWMDITELNMAFWEGRKEKATFTKQTHIPPAGAPPAPKNLRAQVDENGVRLTWEGKGPFKVYRAAPDRAEYTPVVLSTTENAFAEPLPGGGLSHYAVTTAGQKESGFSNVAGAMKLVDPWGIAIAANGSRFIRDRGFEQTVLQKPDGSFVGRIGSVHMHFEGSDDLALDAKGRIYCAKDGDGYSPQPGFRILNAEANMIVDHRADAGDGPQDFRKPAGIDATKDGVFFIADRELGRVSVWKLVERSAREADARFLYTIGTKGEGDGQFQSPIKPLFDATAKRLYVSDSAANRILVFAWDGDIESAAPKYVTSWAPGLSKPLGMALDKQGRVVVADSGNARVVTLDANGAIVDSWSDGLKEPRGVAVTADGTLVAVDGARKQVLSRK